jgi:hypothetical protein
VIQSQEAINRRAEGLNGLAHSLIGEEAAIVAYRPFRLR